MGEPLANYERVVNAVRRITSAAPDGSGISQRSVVLSTVVLAPAIRKLAGESFSVSSAVSLHTPDDGLRDTLVPVTNRWSVAEVLYAAKYYADTSGHRPVVIIVDADDAFSVAGAACFADGRCGERRGMTISGGVAVMIEDVRLPDVIPLVAERVGRIRLAG